MEKEKISVSEGVIPIWNSCGFGMEMESNELNSVSENLPNCFFNPNWENSMDHSDPFESAMSSIVSSPIASNVGGDTVMIKELIGRLGNICNSHEVLTQSSCYSTPLNSPPKRLNLSIMDSQLRGNFPITANSLPNLPSLAPLQADPGFAERAARFSCFGGRNLAALNGQFGFNESEFPPRVEPGKLSRVSSNHSMKVVGSLVNVQEGNKSLPDKKFNRLSRPSTPENAEVVNSREESSVSEQIPVAELKGQNDTNSRKRKSIPGGKSKGTPSSSLSASDVAKASAEKNPSSVKRCKSDEVNEKKKDGKEDESGNQKQNDKHNSKPPEPPKDYIHVRARRGQATDSHSLAERVRREKISERMKFLQDLVPGCNKVTGKAVMLDEIINYVQSLQRQVEFLSMKLATVNPKMDFNMDALLSKEIFQSAGSMNQNLYPLDSAPPSFPYGYQSQQGLHLQRNGMSSNAETSQFSMNQLNSVLQQNPRTQLPALDGFGDASRQVPTFWEDDLQSLVQMGFGQDQQQSFHGSMPTAHMKMEM